MIKMLKKRINFTSGIKLLYVLAAGLFLLSACGNTEQTDSNDADVPMESAAIGADFEYPFVAESENGYYFWERLSADQYYPRLMFRDKDSGSVVPLCNKPDCTHEGQECNAYFPELDFETDGIDKHYIQYYQGSLYAVGVSSDNYVALFCIKEDGSEWKISTKLYRADYAATGFWRTLEILIDDGYVYFVDTKQKNMKLERIPIGGKTAEVIFEGDSDAGEVQICRIKSNEDDGFVFFQARVFFGESYEQSVAGVYRCDANGQCELVKIGISGSYSVQNGLVYYANEEGLCRYSLQDGTTEILGDNQIMGLPYITLTKNYIILCDHMTERELTIYDYKGNQIATVSCNLKPTWYFGGNSDFLFAECMSNNETSLCFLDLTRPLEELQWEKLAVD